MPIQARRQQEILTDGVVERKQTDLDENRWLCDSGESLWGEEASTMEF